MIEYLPLVLTGIGLTASIIYYAMVLRNQNKTRQAQLFMDLHGSHISLPTMAITVEMMYEWEWDSFDDFDSKYMFPDNKENQVKFMHYFASLERIGVLCRRGLIDPELVYDSQYSTIIFIWEKFLPIIEEYRVRMNAPQIYEDPEYLYKEMIRIREERGHQSMTLINREQHISR
jgi:hypothetical protein